MSVNNKRQYLLETFQNQSNWVSGEDLSGRLGISRVAVWKHIKALQEEGYSIESGHKGYRLREENDNLSSLDFNSHENILFYRELESTMQEARDHLKNPGESKGDFIILTDSQSAGINRGGDVWQSPRGGIYMTCVLNSPFSLKDAALIPFRGILAVIRTLKILGDKPAVFRWPGDILMDGMKIGGVLEEYLVRGGKVLWYALGVGVHLNDTLTEEDRKGTEKMASVADVSGDKILRKDFVRRFRGEWKTCLNLSPGELIEALNRNAPFLDTPVRIETNDGSGIREGIARKIDSNGLLHLLSDSNSLRLTAGECIKLMTGEIKG